ncbi:MAG: carbohydrate ABC transporter permease [bacterium]
MKKRINNYFTHFILCIASIFILVPIVWMFMTSFKYFKDIVSAKIIFKPTLFNYYNLFFEDKGFLLFFKNSIIIAFFSMLLCVFIGTLGAYGLSRFKWSNCIPLILLGWVVVVQTIPGITLVIPLYSIGMEMNILDTKLFMILINTILNIPLMLWLMMSFFKQIPDEIEEAALMDGASSWIIFVKIMLPLTKPAVIAGGLMTFIFSWKEFLMALNLTSTLNAMPLTVRIARFIQSYNVQYGNVAAAATLGAIPAILLAVFAQRYITSGITSGAVKG